MSPARKRQAVAHVRERLGVSERRACRVLGQARTSQHYRPKRSEEERRLVGRMLELVGRHPRYGYRRIWALLRREGWRVNRKRVYRLWRREGLKVPQRRRRKRTSGSSQNGCAVRRAAHPNHVWSWDFLQDRTMDGRPLKWLSLVDEYTRECLALEVGRSLTAQNAIQVLAKQFLRRGVPGYLRSDNGPEFIAKAIRGWLEATSVQTLYIAPGSPWENGVVESFHSRLRDEFLSIEEFTSLREAKVLADRWRREYNEERPHSSLGYLTPSEFRNRCAPNASTTHSSRQGPRDQEETLIKVGT